MASACSCSRLSKLSISATARLQSSSSTSVRAFSTSSSNLNLQVPPESPAWLQVPKPVQDQSSENKLPPVKGILPVPRLVFRHKNDARKIEPSYLEQTTPKPSNEASQKEAAPGSPLDIRRRMANSRRENLSAGLQGLWERKQIRDIALHNKAIQNFKMNRRAALAPEREDDILGRSSVLSATAASTAVLPDPHRFRKAATSRLKTARIEEQKKEARQDALMELYMNATNFIVDETHLNQEIETIFAEDYWQKQGKSLTHDADNAWDVWGQPPTVGDMLSNMMRTNQRAVEYNQSGQDRTVKRQKMIAEELTGGKME